VLALPRSVTDREDYDLFQRFVSDVISDIRIAAYHELSDAFGFLSPTDQWKESERLERLEDSGTDTLRGLWISLAEIVRNVVEIVYRPASEAQLH
jgi:hypothetical protein